MMQTTKSPLTLTIAASLLMVAAGSVQARWEAYLQDSELVQRAELIVVAHLKAGSAKFVRLPGNSYEYHAVLAVTQMLKGKLAEREFTIVFRHPLVLDFAGNTNCGVYHGDDTFGRRDSLHNADKPDPNVIEFYSQGGGSILGNHRRVADATKDGLWFLHRTNDGSREMREDTRLGILVPQDTQPLQLKEYFKAYLAQNPAVAVKAVVEKEPELTPRAQRFLNRFEIERILKLPDPADRVEKLLPYYLRPPNWDEARAAILTCGPATLPALRKIFSSPKHENYTFIRKDIMGIFGELKDTESVPVLIAMLEAHEKFWAEQKLFPGWWNNEFNSPLTQKRHNLYIEDSAAVRALGQIGDGKAKAVIEKTKRRWDGQDIEGNAQIREGCAWALQVLGGAK